MYFSVPPLSATCPNSHHDRHAFLSRGAPDPGPQDQSLVGQDDHLIQQGPDDLPPLFPGQAILGIAQYRPQFPEHAQVFLRQFMARKHNHDLGAPGLELVKVHP